MRKRTEAELIEEVNGLCPEWRDLYDDVYEAAEDLDIAEEREEVQGELDFSTLTFAGDGSVPAEYWDE
jgi:hypothetical protein